MANNIVQLTDYNDNNIYPIAGAAAQGSITKTMLAEGVFEGPELSEPSSVAYVAEDNIQDDAVTTDKIADGSVTSDKIDYATIGDTLYTSDSGSAVSTSIPLDGNLYNYQRVKVIFSSNANRYATAEIVSPSSGQYWPLSISFANGSTMVVRSATYRTYSSSLSFVEYNGKVLGSDGSVTSESTNFIRIHKVIGYK